METVLKRIRPRSEQAARAGRLYRAAFPDNERAPLMLLARRAARGRADWWSICEDGVWRGFFYAVRHAELVYLFYFAVEPEARGQGCGTRALAALCAQYPHCRVFLAAEALDRGAENYEERVRRKRFYLRAGMEELHTRVREGDVIYELLGVGGAVAAREYGTLMRRWAGRVLGRTIRTKMLPQDKQEDNDEPL